MQKLFLTETPRQLILTITADDDITNTGQNSLTCVEFVRPVLNHGSFEMQVHGYTSIALSQNKNEQLYETGSARGDAWLRRISFSE